MTFLEDLHATFRLVPFIAETVRWDTARRYRLTVLGPFVISLGQCAVMTFTAFVLGRVLAQDFMHFLPYVVLSNALWLFISNALAPSTTIYLQRAPQLLTQPMPLLLVPAIHLAQISVQFAHDLIPPLILLILIYGPKASWLLALPAFGLWMVTALAVIHIIATYATRHVVIIGTIIGTATQCLLLVTPILWPVGQLGPFAWVQAWNPIFAYVEIVRAPLLGVALEAWAWPAALGWTAMLLVSAVFVHRQARARLTFWIGSA